MFKEFKESAQNVRDENGSLLELVDLANDTVTSAAALGAFREEKAQEAKSVEKKANVQLRLLKDKMKALVLRKNDSLVISWNDTMVMTKQNKQQKRENFEEMIKKGLTTIPKEDWKK